MLCFRILQTEELPWSEKWKLDKRRSKLDCREWEAHSFTRWEKVSKLERAYTPVQMVSLSLQKSWWTFHALNSPSNYVAVLTQKFWGRFEEEKVQPLEWKDWGHWRSYYPQAKRLIAQWNEFEACIILFSLAVHGHQVKFLANVPKANYFDKKLPSVFPLQTKTWINREDKIISSIRGFSWRCYAITKETRMSWTKRKSLWSCLSVCLSELRLQKLR